MYGMNGMGWGMGLTGLLVLVLLVLGIAALVKYLSGRDLGTGRWLQSTSATPRARWPLPAPSRPCPRLESKSGNPSSLRWAGSRGEAVSCTWRNAARIDPGDLPRGVSRLRHDRGQ
jgi:hypothetical protein